MLRVIIILLTLALPAGDYPIAMMIPHDCDGHCAEPYFTPRFHFKVVEGVWPEQGPLQCHASGRQITCRGGLVLEIEKVTFRAE